jgi:hypothetical protein
MLEHRFYEDLTLIYQPALDILTTPPGEQEFEPQHAPAGQPIQSHDHGKTPPAGRLPTTLPIASQQGPPLMQPPRQTLVAERESSASRNTTGNGSSILESRRPPAVTVPSSSHGMQTMALPLNAGAGSGMAQALPHHPQQQHPNAAVLLSGVHPGSPFASPRHPAESSHRMALPLAVPIGAPGVLPVQRVALSATPPGAPSTGTNSPPTSAGLAPTSPGRTLIPLTPPVAPPACSSPHTRPASAGNPAGGGSPRAVAGEDDMLAQLKRPYSRSLSEA